jgi:hypothetical protein
MDPKHPKTPIRGLFLVQIVGVLCTPRSRQGAMVDQVSPFVTERAAGQSR